MKSETVFENKLFSEIDRQMKNKEYTPKYITLSTTHMDNDIKFRDMGLEPCYVEDLNESSVYLT